MHKALLLLFLSNVIVYWTDSLREGFFMELNRKGLMRGHKETPGASPETACIWIQEWEFTQEKRENRAEEEPLKLRGHLGANTH